ncbi:GTPase HflX [Eisenbergiella tayi]|uniref:GTPase HflX n=1 Tax=Eisenbergiella tayi TaxID=1432052 RepID=A0A1E3AZ43_9FIRM|nr:GTPase HflX [Eisenbergiella tayi]ODM13904.1 GTPase HflX [Eisenbergiella tayi]OIZ66394.1 GTPase HflX [Eisenbergiella tayi]
MNENNNTQQENISRVLLVGVNVDDNPDFETSMEELESLAEACEMEVTAKIEQNLSSLNPAYYIGSGKVKEVQETVEQMDLDYVIFDETLSPSQLKNLQKEVGVPIMDRTNLILEIFSRRAKTREARLQVESANLQYMLPRLVGMREALGRQAGASGSMSNKGTGEKQIELDRRKIEKRISELRRELEAIEHDRNTQRKRRNDSSLPQVALVGYTNAGKSTLMNKMVETYVGKEEKMVVARDMLFATLDTTVRKINQNDRKDFLLSDTVGFISKLPHGLVKAFRSTLDEVRYADLLLQIVDASDEHYREHIQVTEETLRELGAEKIPCIYVMNKADLIMAKEELPRIDGNKIFMSARDGIGLQELLQMIKKRVFSGNREGIFLIPYEKGEIVSYLNSNATVSSQEYLAEGVKLFVDCRESDYSKYREYLFPED